MPITSWLPLHVASLHVGRTSGPPRALDRGGRGESPASADGQHEDRPTEGPGLPGKGAHLSWGMPIHAPMPTSVVPGGSGGSRESSLDPSGDAALPVTAPTCLLKNGLNDSWWASGGSFGVTWLCAHPLCQKHSFRAC